MDRFTKYRKRVWHELWSRFWAGMAKASIVCVPTAIWILVNNMPEERRVIDGGLVVFTTYLTIVVVGVFTLISIANRKWEREATIKAQRDALAAEWNNPTTGEG